MPPTRGFQAVEGSSTTMEQLKPPKPSHKRKRDSPDQNGQGRTRNAPGHSGSGGTNDGLDDILLGEADDYHLSQQLARHNNAAPTNTTAATQLATRLPQLTVPQPTDLSFQATNPGNDEDHVESSFDMSGVDSNHNAHAEGTPYNLDGYAGNGASRNQASPGLGSQKPAVGSEEWHKVRKENHKEVERRRRETINEGINELAKIVPGCDKNKGAILQRGVSFIAKLKENEKSNIEKWTLEKLLTDQTIQELSSTNEKLKIELERVYTEAERWKKRCIDGGLAPKDSNGASTDSTGT